MAATFSGGSVGIGDTTSIVANAIPSGSLVVGNGVICVDNSGDNCDDSTRTAGGVYALSVTASLADLAEEFPIEVGDSVEAGEIVVIDTHKGRSCLESTSNSQGEKTCIRDVERSIPFVKRSPGTSTVTKRILGVVSTSPGITLGGFAREELINYAKVPVALGGRIPVKVSNENGEIEIGDRITVSSIPGVGARARAGDVVVGMALEASEGTSEVAKILMLVK